MYQLPPHWDERRAALLSMLRRLSYEEREVTLSSGQRSHFYIDCKQTMLTGEGHVLLGACFSDLLERAEVAHPDRSQPRHAAVGGLTMGADPLSSATALWSTLHGRPLHAIYVRKEAKGHGTGAFLEGTKSVPVGARVAVVEDVVTTGNASKTAVERLRAYGYAVDTVLAIVDRQAGGREALHAQGLHVHALFDLRDFPRRGNAA
ncbi:MAG: orotate phosphoribosyltransferase [Deltaproteobacteria bacterium]|nr:orotate phosphoribosyltransferase [Deltaproteobacteria bacterium]